MPPSPEDQIEAMKRRKKIQKAMDRRDTEKAIEPLFEREEKALGRGKAGKSIRQKLFNAKAHRT